MPAIKPDPAGLLRLLAETGTRPEDAAMVGDSAVDVAAGRAASVFTVGVTFGLDPGGLVAARPDAVIHDLRELPAVLDAREALIPRS